MALSLYIHYPFCVRKCRYCDFLSGPDSRSSQEAYCRALCREIACSGMEGAVVDTIFFGGGTPSLMEPADLEQVMGQLRTHFRILPAAEISLECNPGTVDEEKLRTFRGLGINRLSLGVQSFRDQELQLLGRIHTAAEAVACYEAARRAGYDNINLDLMSALPGQSYTEWMQNLAEAAALGPEHISAYSLILEEGTPLEQAAERGELPPVPEDEEDRRMYHDTRSFLQQYGYERYEISNYARAGRECRHNLGYWSGHDYLGLGLGSSSLIGSARFHNVRNLQQYEALCEGDTEEGERQAESSNGAAERETSSAPRTPQRNGTPGKHGIPFRSRCIPGLQEEIEMLSCRDRMGEFMWLGLRKTAGVSEREFGHRFGVSLMSVFGDVIQEHCSRGLLVRENGWIRLTEYGTDISNFVMADFV